jgi:hypothetical protein
MAKKNATAVSVIPVRDDSDTRLLQQLFSLTMEEWSFLKRCASALRPSDCTAKQRLLFRQLRERDLVTVIEYPCLDGPRWVLSSFGETIAHAASMLTGVNNATIAPAKVLQFPSPR